MSSDIACSRCGACCDREGYVYVTADEVDRIAAYLDMKVAAFTDRYTRISDDRKRLSLMDSHSGGCIFLGGDRLCRIQAVKPRQCAGFPWHWRYEGYEEFCAIGRAIETEAGS